MCFLNHDPVSTMGRGTVGAEEKSIKLNTDYIPWRRPLELDQVVVGAVGGEEGAGVLEVLALRVALQRLVARLLKYEEPVCKEDAPRSEAVRELSSTWSGYRCRRATRPSESKRG